MAITWDDDIWILQTEQPTHGCAPPYVGNGRIGLRLGALMLGTDREAQPLISAGPERSMMGQPRWDHSYPLQSFSSFGRDAMMLCLPSWANLDLVVGGQRFQPQGLPTSSNNPLRAWVDMRTGEAGLDGGWNTNSGPITVALRVLIPRGRANSGAFWELTLDGLKKPAEIGFGLIGAHLLNEIDIACSRQGGDLLANLRTKNRGRAIGVGMRWQCDAAGGATEAVRFGTPGNADVQILANGPKVTLRVFTSIRGGIEPYQLADTTADLDLLQRGIADGSVRRENADAWRKIWNDGVDVTTLPVSRRDQQFLLAQMFYLLCSYDGSGNPVGAIGLSGNMWRGQMMWDCDLWHFRALNALWPNLARQTVRARLAMLPEARRHAEKLNLIGAWYGWMCDENGEETAPEHYQPEIHVNAWIALAAYESAKRSDDPVWQREVYPILAGIADGVCSRAVRDDDGGWHLRKVLPPDESVVENPKNPGTCDDNVATNLAFANALRAAVDIAKTLGEPASPRWAEVAAGLAILPPGPDGIIPEYRGYDGHIIKQGDLILAFYPLGLQLPNALVQANVDYYRDKIISGPLMTEQVDACVRMQRKLGDRTAILRDLIKRYRRYVHGAFEVPYECVDNSNSLMLTACGGLIATLVYGWFGVANPQDCNRTNVPRIGGDT